MSRAVAVWLSSLTLVAVITPPARADADHSYAPGAVLVRLRAHTRVGLALRRAGADGPGTAVSDTATRVVPVDGDPARIATRIRRAPGVRWAEPDWTMHVLKGPDDPLFRDQHDLATLGFPGAWDAVGLGESAGWTAGSTVPVGIVDTGIDAGHEDLKGRVTACATAHGGRVTEGSCEDDNGHGTHVAGTIGAIAGNGVGIAGIAYASPLVICKALGGADGSGDTSDVAACIAWAHRAGARVISMSLGGPPSATLADAVRTAYARGGHAGSLLVAAAGNDGDGSLEYPAALPDVISVAAVDDSQAPASFSNANADVELAAPGVDVLSTRAGGGYVRMSGTSMATPHVAAEAALLAAADDALTVHALRLRLDVTAHDLGTPGRDPATGFGLVDIAAAISAPAD